MNKRILCFAAGCLFALPIFACAQIAWLKNLDSALKQAAKEKKFVVLDISASW
jgi:hypothetical protein